VRRGVGHGIFGPLIGCWILGVCMGLPSRTWGPIGVCTTHGVSRSLSAIFALQLSQSCPRYHFQERIWPFPAGSSSSLGREGRSGRRFEATPDSEGSRKTRPMSGLAVPGRASGDAHVVPRRFPDFGPSRDGAARRLGAEAAARKPLTTGAAGPCPALSEGAGNLPWRSARVVLPIARRRVSCAPAQADREDG